MKQHEDRNERLLEAKNLDTNNRIRLFSCHGNWMMQRCKKDNQNLKR